MHIVPDWFSFAAFRLWAQASGYHQGAYLLRLDRTDHFHPDNCAWTALSNMAEIGAAAPRELQAFGQAHTVEEWSRDVRCSVSVSTLRKRLDAGWTLERAMTTPPREVPHYTAFGETKSATAWVRDPRCVVTLSTVRGRLAHGWKLEQALTTPTTETRERHTPRYTAFGETHSRTEWLCDPRCQVTRATLRQRLARGWTLERALTAPPGVARDLHMLTAWGETKTVLAWAHDPRCVLGARGLLARMQQGWPPEEALTIPSRQDTQRMLLAFGVSRTLAAWLQDPRCQAGPRVIRQRLRQGWNVEQALTTPGGLSRLSQVTAFGETQSVAAWAADARCQVSRTLLMQRLRKGWSPENALGTPLRHSTKRTAYTAFGETKSLAAWVRDVRCVVAEATVFERLARGWTPVDAITTLPLPPPHGMALTAEGETRTMSAWLADPRCRVTRKALNLRLAKGWTVTEALLTPPGARRGHQLTAFGITQSLQAWARDLRCVVSSATLSARLTAGWPMEDALTTAPFQRLPQLTAFGETQPLADWVQDPRCVVTRATLLERLRDGWPAERAIATPSRRTRPTAKQQQSTKAPSARPVPPTEIPEQEPALTLAFDFS